MRNPRYDFPSLHIVPFGRRYLTVGPASSLEEDDAKSPVRFPVPPYRPFWEAILDSCISQGAYPDNKVRRFGSGGQLSATKVIRFVCAWLELSAYQAFASDSSAYILNEAAIKEVSATGTLQN